jgi:hypothetical protein
MRGFGGGGIGERPRPGGRSLLGAICVLACLLPAHSRAASLETAIEATYLLKFVPFVNWPESALGTATEPFVICVAGDDPFGDRIDRVVAGEHLGEHPVSLRRLAVVTRSSGCEVLYVAGSPEQSVAQAVAMVAGQPVLTVSNTARDGGPPGIIDFVLSEGRVRFAIDDAAAEKNHLTISSKLLSLALTVRPRPCPKGNPGPC